ncbi:MAG: RDD family protein [Chitinophagaceae bacterium]|nr:RDD family protein [Chitinophagaceae bacterium]
MEQVQPENPGLFEDFVQQRTASTGQRFVNWLVDNLLMRFGLSFLTGYVVGFFIANFFPAFAERITYEQDTWDLIILGYAIGIFNYLIYYTICEKAFRGYTLGKLITGTRAIREDGQELTFKDAFLRSLCRLVPFEVFSGLGDRPWHDAWTDTKVIQVR